MLPPCHAAPHMTVYLSREDEIKVTPKSQDRPDPAKLGALEASGALPSKTCSARRSGHHTTPAGPALTLNLMPAEPEVSIFLLLPTQPVTNHHGNPILAMTQTRDAVLISMQPGP